MREINRLIIHHSLTKDSLTVSAGAIRRYHMETLGWRAVGYHYLQERIGDYEEILKGRFHHEIGAHTKGHNHDSIGICLIGNYDLTSPFEDQYQLLAKLCAEIMYTYDLPMNDVYPHSEFADKTCPGTMFSMDYLKHCIARAEP